MSEKSTSTTDAPVEQAPEAAAAGRAPRGARVSYALLVVGALISAFAVIMVPPERFLGPAIKLVLFHGASVWINLLTFTLTGILAAAWLITRRRGVRAYEVSLRYTSFGLWIVNTVLGMVSARMTWGDSFMREPRLQASFWIMALVGVAVIVDIIMERPDINAALDLAILVGIWVFVIFTPRDIHPDSPILKSTGEIPLCFAAMAVGVSMAVAGFVRLLTIRVLKTPGRV